jgi:hypothetical protein
MVLSKNRHFGMCFDAICPSKDYGRLFSDGELMIVTPDAVRAAIEVKTAIDRSGVEATLVKVAANKQKWDKTLWGSNNHVGLFVYEERVNCDEVLLKTLEKVRTDRDVIVDCVAFGPDVYVDVVNSVGERKFNGWGPATYQGLGSSMLHRQTCLSLLRQKRASGERCMAPCARGRGRRTEIPCARKRPH